MSASPSLARTHRLPVHAKSLAAGHVLEAARELPIRGRHDVIVCGAGPAGVGAGQAAGLAAARAVREGCDPAEVDGAALRAELAAQGCRFVHDGVAFQPQ